jgi:hypothetical protein
MTSSTEERIAHLNDRIARMEKLTERVAHELDVQFKRIAQRQAEVEKCAQPPRIPRSFSAGRAGSSQLPSMPYA